MLMRPAVILLSFFNPVLLINCYEDVKESIRKRSFQSKFDPNIISLLRWRKTIKSQYVDFLRIELGLEIFYQTTGQILLVLLSQTRTATTGGLARLFEQNSYLGLSPQSIITVLVIWSMRTGVSIHYKSVIADKVAMRYTSKVVVLSI